MLFAVKVGFIILVNIYVVDVVRVWLVALSQFTVNTVGLSVVLLGIVPDIADVPIITVDILQSL